MKRASLSLRLGLTVTLLGAALVLLLACLAVFALDHELDSRARKDLARKMLQVEHNLRVDLRSDDLGSRAHPLLDLVMGHDNLSLSVMAVDARHPALISLGPALQSQHLLALDADARLTFHEWRNDDGNQMLTASSLMRLRDDTPVKVLMSLNRDDDNALLQAYLNSTLLALPLLLLLIGIAAWKLVQRGLRPCGTSVASPARSRPRTWVIACPIVTCPWNWPTWPGRSMSCSTASTRGCASYHSFPTTWPMNCAPRSAT